MTISGDKRQKIVEKIRLLFNLADNAVKDGKDSAENHEAQLALETARKMLLNYGLEEAEVRLSEDQDTFKSSGGYVVNPKGFSRGKWVKSLAVTVADYFCVRVVTLKMKPGDQLHSYLFFGVDVGSQLAAYAFKSCHDQIRTLARRYKVGYAQFASSRVKFMFKDLKEYQKAAREEYRMGIIVGFQRRHQEIKRQEEAAATALALSYEQVAEDFLEKQKISVKSKAPKKKLEKFTLGDHFEKGVKDSDQVQLTSALKA
jgi:hypothetical protein